jgi:hypothetical protein
MTEKLEKLNLKTKLRAAYQVCHSCGVKYGEVRNYASTIWNGQCDVCGKEGSVTESRDYGFLWKGIRDLEGKKEENAAPSKPKYVTRLQTITIENVETYASNGLTEIQYIDEGGGAYVTLTQDGNEITLDPEEIDLVYEACKKLLSQ